jgi:phage shock protein C
MRRRLYRSRNEKVVAGVCGGLAEYFNIDPTLVRLAVVLLVFAGAGFPILAYIIAMIIVPKEPLLDGVETAADAAVGEANKVSSEERRQARAAAREAERELRRERREERERNRSTFSKVLPGGLLVLFGLLFMTKNFYWWHWGDLAPLALIFVGGYFILRQWDMKNTKNGSGDSSSGNDAGKGHNGHGAELSVNGGNS